MENPETSELKPRHIAAVTLGNALEFYDFLTYSFFSIQIGHTLFPSKNSYVSLILSTLIFFAGFIGRPFGGFFIGLYADRAGRRPAMLLSFVLMGFSILALALIPSYAAIGVAAPILAVVIRLVQGFSLGGEIGSNTAFLLEAASPERRGFIVSWQGASQLIALLCGSLVGLALTSYLTAAQLDSYGWRIAFLVGAVTVPFGLWLRTRLPETLHVTETQASVRDMPTMPRIDLVQRHWRIMVLGAVVLGAATIANYVVIYMVTYAQHTLHLTAREGFVVETVNTLVGIPSALLGGWFSDRLGRRPVNLSMNLGLVVSIYPLFLWITATQSLTALIVSMMILGVFVNASFGSFCSALAESLPKSIRVAGFGTTYSVAIGLLGGSTQTVITWMIQTTGSAMAPAWYVLGAAIIGQVALMLVPESAPSRIKLPVGAVPAAAK